MATTLTMPEIGARKPTARMVAAKALGALWTWRRRHVERVELERLLDRADDRMLSDVGLTRSIVADEAGKPFWRA
ncbi:MAG: hypothetical protein RIM80_23080 [Alphaproteobacteria bacterium]